MTSPASSEMARSAALFASLSRSGRLLASRAPQPGAVSGARPSATPPPAKPAADPPTPPVRSTATMRPVAPVRDPAPHPAAPPPAGTGYRSEQMGAILRNMCKRGGFSGAVVADRGGLPLAEFNSPVELEIMAALGSVLGGSLEQAANLLQRPEANNLSLDINYVDKVVLRTFDFERLPYHLLVVCPQAVDERSEVELSIEQIQSVLSHDM